MTSPIALSDRITRLALPGYAHNALLDNNISFIRDITRHSYEELVAMPVIGEVTATAIAHACALAGFPVKGAPHIQPPTEESTMAKKSETTKNEETAKEANADEKDVAATTKAEEKPVENAEVKAGGTDTKPDTVDKKDTGSKVTDTGSKVTDTGSKVTDTGGADQDAGVEMKGDQNTEPSEDGRFLAKEVKATATDAEVTDLLNEMGGKGYRVVSFETITTGTDGPDASPTVRTLAIFMKGSGRTNRGW